MFKRRAGISRNSGINRNLDRANFEIVIKVFYDLPEPDSDEYAGKIDELQESLHFNLGYIELCVVKAVGLDVYEEVWGKKNKQKALDK